MNDPTNNSFLQATGYDEGLIHYYMAMEDKTFISGSGWLPPDDYNPTQRPWYQKVKEYNQLFYRSLSRSKFRKIYPYQP